MLIRPFQSDDLDPIITLTIETFGPFFEDSFRPAVGEVVFANQHGDWRGDYRREIPTLHDPAHHRFVDIAEVAGAIAGYVAWNADTARRSGSISHVAVARGYRRHHTGQTLCEHAFDGMRRLGVEVVEIGTGGDSFHAPARALYEKLGCTPFPTIYYYRRL